MCFDRRILLMFLLINTYLSVITTALIQSTNTAIITKQWNLLEYDFDINLPINDKNFFNPQNIVATGIAVSYDRIFIATPRLFSGVSATVSTISKTNYDKTPLLEAYPNWSFHTTSLKTYNCSDLGLVSVYRLRIDSCNRLWALDAGISRSLEDFEVTCPPKILIFDLNTNQVVRRIDFPKEVIRGESLFTNLIIDETTSKPGSNCDDVFVYISDTVEPGIVVYDSGNDLTWRVSHPSMYPDPDFAQSEIDDQKFVLMDGIVGLAFDERTGLIYFQPLATERLFSVTKQVLRAGPLSNNEVLPVRLVGKKSSQGIGLTVSPFDSSIIFSPMTETAVASWNPNTNKQSILAYDPVTLQFVADMSLSNYEPNSFYCISSKFHRFFLKNLNTNEYNTRIIKMNLPISTLSDVSSAYTSSQLTKSTGSTATGSGAGSVTAPGLSSPILSKFSTYNSHQHNHHNHNNPFGLTQLNTNSLLERKTNNNNNNINQNQYFYGIEQPYQYEPVGLINRGITNPFTALNQGEEFPKKSTALLQSSQASTSSSSSSPSDSTISITKSSLPSSPSSLVPLIPSPSSSSSSSRLHHHHHSTSSVIPLNHENYLNRIPSATAFFNFNSKLRFPNNFLNQTQFY